MTQALGLAIPFQRDRKRDFAAASGDDLRCSQVLQVLLTCQGELAWDNRFGTRLHTLRHAKPDAATCALARRDVLQALQYAMPALAVREVTVKPAASGLRIEVTVGGGANERDTVVLDIGDAHAFSSIE